MQADFREVACVTCDEPLPGASEIGPWICAVEESDRCQARMKERKPDLYAEQERYGEFMDSIEHLPRRERIQKMREWERKRS